MDKGQGGKEFVLPVNNAVSGSTPSRLAPRPRDGDAFGKTPLLDGKPVASVPHRQLPSGGLPRLGRGRGVRQKVETARRAADRAHKDYLKSASGGPAGRHQRRHPPMPARTRRTRTPSPRALGQIYLDDRTTTRPPPRIRERADAAQNKDSSTSSSRWRSQPRARVLRKATAWSNREPRAPPSVGEACRTSRSPSRTRILPDATMTGAARHVLLLALAYHSSTWSPQGLARATATSLARVFDFFPKAAGRQSDLRGAARERAVLGPDQRPAVIAPMNDARRRRALACVVLPQRSSHVPDAGPTRRRPGGHRAATCGRSPASIRPQRRQPGVDPVRKADRVRASRGTRRRSWSRGRTARSCTRSTPASEGGKDQILSPARRGGQHNAGIAWSPTGDRSPSRATAASATTMCSPRAGRQDDALRPTRKKTARRLVAGERSARVRLGADWQGRPTSSTSRPAS